VKKEKLLQTRLFTLLVIASPKPCAVPRFAGFRAKGVAISVLGIASSFHSSQWQAI